MPRWVRISIRIFIGIVVVILLFWGGVAIYIKSHKQEILQKLTITLSEKVRGRLSIRDMEPSVWRSFPNVEVSLKDVTLRDSLWEMHRHSLLDVKDLYVKLNVAGLLSHKVEIKKLTAAHGSAFLYSNGTGYSNAYLLSQRDTTKKNRTSLLEEYGLEDIHFYYINEEKNKDFHLYISALDGTATQAAGVIHYKYAAKAHAYNLAFSTIRGSYLRNQDLRLSGPIDYYIADKKLDIPQQKVKIGGETVLLSGIFRFDRIPSAFELHLYADDVPFEAVKSWASPNISQKIGAFTFVKRIGVRADISGVMQYKTIPLIKATMAVRDNILKTPLGNVEHMWGDGQYYNEVVAGKGHGDDNSEIRFTSLKGSWMNLPFEGDTLSVKNLLVPYVNAHLKSAFPVERLNAVLGVETFSFDKGDAAADLHYLGGILPEDPTPYSLNGFVTIKDGAMTYIPRNLAFNDVGARLLFQDDNLFLRDIAVRTKGSSVRMEGEALHFFRLYFADPGKILVSWRARSPQIDLNEFRSFAGRRRAQGTKRSGTGAPVSRIGRQLDKVLDAGSFALDAKVDKLLYKNFTASNIVARAKLEQNGIQMQQVALTHAGGTLTLSGIIRQQERLNPFQLKAVFQNVDVANIFHSFNNFGQDAIVGDNLRGKLNATANVNGGMTEDGTIVKNSLNGTVDFRLEDGELNNFSPFEKISKYVFKKRNLDHVTFKDLSNKLDIEGSKITIHPMNIQTSAINMQVAGVYSLSTGTDIAIQIPLRNPSRDKARSPIGKLLRATGKGIVVHLRAQDGGTGGVKIGWDPMHKGEKALADDMKLD